MSRPNPRSSGCTSDPLNVDTARLVSPVYSQTNELAKLTSSWPPAYRLRLNPARALVASRVLVSNGGPPLPTWANVGFSPAFHWRSNSKRLRVSDRAGRYTRSRAVWYSRLLSRAMSKLVVLVSRTAPASVRGRASSQAGHSSTSGTVPSRPQSRPPRMPFG